MFRNALRSRVIYVESEPDTFTRDFPGKKLQVNEKNLIIYQNQRKKRNTLLHQGKKSIFLLPSLSLA